MNPIHSNQALSNEIVNHIFNNLGLTFISKNSLASYQFLLKDTIDYVDQNDSDAKAKVYGCQVSLGASVVKLMAANFSDLDLEFALIVKIENCPTYGCYLLIDSKTGDADEGLIGFAINPNNWLNSNIALQGTFLAGMESLRDITYSWDSLKIYNEMLDEMKSFIKFRDDILE